MATDKRVYTLRLQEKNFQKIKEIADRSKRPIAMQIEFAIERFVEDYEQENGSVNIEEE